MSRPPRFRSSDYSVAVKLNTKPENSWRWEIHRAGQRKPVAISSSSSAFRSMSEAKRAGQQALKEFLIKNFGGLG